MLKRDWLFGTVATVLGFAPITAVYANANADCEAPEALVAPRAIFSPVVALADTAAAPESDSTQIDAATTAFRFKLMSPVLRNDTSHWQMPAGRYWFSLEVSEAKVAQEGIGIADENIESWLLAPADSLAVPF